MSPQQCHATGQLISLSACEILDRIDKSANLSNSKREASIPRFHRDEIVLDDLVGKGGFNSVFSIHEFSLDKTKKYSVAQQVFRERVSKEPDNYVIKFLSDKFENDSAGYANGSLDLVVEAKILANLRHKNVIRLHGISSEGVHGLKTRVEGNFFLVLDRLTCTLRDLQQDWLKTWPSGPLHRLQIAIQIAEGLCYLRRKKVLHRDIKPENVGFSRDGKPLLYDFGFAKILPNRDDNFALTAMCGTLRYMSPECAMSRKYGMASDVYSFTLLLWEILTLEVPFREMSRAEILDQLECGDYELPLQEYWPSDLKKCIKNGFSSVISKRPTIETMHSTLIRQIGGFESEQEASSISKQRSVPKMGQLVY
mmetsp:Transcript_22856/g.34660  ORF Transcript_22856/g.34660 Transcript_22856/m.34660 type:complete len:367 (+) Transcript_22856:145-1245(+)|eukprot:CAMPEP_0194200490 /NCGR_PEP_ID=MMETSP0156-20130528/1072_1 /TAXON_ID=33649 /ORGANISM="Thalassionema nitzschioides, Strain L26-B" /LENGTH=366 /DNA_ID=CAMNT_0038925493 /DNA_START=46 /DNA_END=1146 /DNA_ORIENTATION=-